MTFGSVKYSSREYESLCVVWLSDSVTPTVAVSSTNIMTLNPPAVVGQTGSNQGQMNPLRLILESLCSQP